VEVLPTVANRYGSLRNGVIICATWAYLGAALNGDFRVGTWLVQPNLNTVSSNGTAVRLEPKVMEVLVCLASRPDGEPVSKEAILKIVWPDTFVTEDVLTRSISELRRVFQDDARQPKFIQTISKRGYRLVAPRKPASGDGSETTSATRRPLLAKSFAAASALGVLVVSSLVIHENGWRNWQGKRPTAESSSVRAESRIQGVPPDSTSEPPETVLPKLIRKPSATLTPRPAIKKRTQITATEPGGRPLSPSEHATTSRVSVESQPAGVETSSESHPLQSSLANGPTGLPGVDTRTSLASVQPAPARIGSPIQNIQPEAVRTRVTHAVLPTYPADAVQAHVTGTVEIGLGVSPHGDVGNARVLIGHPMLITAALEAIRQWRFQPNQAQGELTWSRMRALVRFRADGTTAVAFAPPLLTDSFGDPGTQRDERRDASMPPIVPEAH